MRPGGDAIWAALPVPAIVLDAGNRIARANPAAEAFVMRSEQALGGRPLADCLTLEAPLDEALARARRDRAPLFVNDVAVGAGGRAPVQCSLQIAPLAGQTGHMIVLISPREMARRVSQGLSVRTASRSAIGMAEMLAHEIKNPLAGITGAAQLLSMNLDREARELTDLIVSESRRIVGLLAQVEEFGNVGAPHRQAVNLHDVLDRARRSAMVGVAAHMRITDFYDPSLPLALGDADQLVQVFLNLITNAAEAAFAAGGTITLRSYYEQALRVRRAGGEGGAGTALPLQVEVIDDGPGLPPEIAAQVFEPFVSGRDNGTGLGLALAAQIVAAHDGWITVHSVPGNTVFRVSLPRAPANREREEG